MRLNQLSTPADLGLCTSDHSQCPGHRVSLKRGGRRATCQAQDSITYPVLSLREPISDLKATLREVMQAESQFCQEVNMGNVEEYVRSGVDSGLRGLTRPEREPDYEATALAGRTGHLQPPSVSHHQIAGDAQT
jgi:hypothetical protein